MLREDHQFCSTSSVQHRQIILEGPPVRNLWTVGRKQHAGYWSSSCAEEMLWRWLWFVCHRICSWCVIRITPKLCPLRPGSHEGALDSILKVGDLRHSPRWLWTGTNRYATRDIQLECFDRIIHFMKIDFTWPVNMLWRSMMRPVAVLSLPTTVM